jgi:hypothetical protein
MSKIPELLGEPVLRVRAVERSGRLRVEELAKRFLEEMGSIHEETLAKQPDV